MRGKILLISSVALLFGVIPHPAYADVSAQLKQAAGYKDNRQYQQAEAIYQQIVTAFPDTNESLEAQKQITIIYITTDRQEQADAAFNKLLASFSGHKGIVKTVYQIGREYYELKKYEKADQLYKYVLDTWPDDTYAVWSQADLIKSYVAEGNDVAADAAVEKLFTTYSGHKDTSEAVYEIARKYYDLEKYEKAGQLYQYVIDKWPNSEQMILAKAGVAKSNILLGNEAAAQAELEKLIVDFNDRAHLPQAI